MQDSVFIYSFMRCQYPLYPPCQGHRGSEASPNTGKLGNVRVGDFSLNKMPVSQIFASFLQSFLNYTWELADWQGIEQRFWENEHAAKLLHRGNVKECLEKQLQIFFFF